MGTWLKEIGDIHQKFYDWATDSTIANWKRVLRMILYYAVDVVLGLVVFWGLLIMIAILMCKFTKGDTEEILED